MRREPERSPDDTTERRSKPDECDFCAFATNELTEYENSRTYYDKNMTYESKWKWLCGLCAGSMGGNAHDYPTQYPSTDAIRTICYVGNVILSRLPKESGGA